MWMYKSLKNNSSRKEHKSWKKYFRSENYKQKQKSVDDKLRKLHSYGHDQEIRKKTIPAENRDYTQVDDDFKTARITSESLNKGNYISRRILDLTGRNLEIYMYSLDNPDSEIIAARDLYIAKKQQVSSGKCRVQGHGVIISNLDIKENLKKKIIGWSHSHASGDPFFSGDDRDNISRLLQTNGQKKKVRVFDSTYNGEGYNGVEYEVRYTPAIVFNARNAKPFVAVAVEYTRLFDRQKVFHINEGVHLNVIEESNGIDIDAESIDRQILERVTYDGRGFSRRKPDDKDLLQDKIAKLEKLYNESRKENEKLRRRNDRLKKVYKRLHSKVLQN